MTPASVASSLDSPDSTTRAMDVTPPKSDSTKSGYRTGSSAQHASSAIVDDAPGHPIQLDSAPIESAVIETRVMGAAGGDPESSLAGSTHTLKVVRFESLARCGDEIWIEHAGQLYRLRKTRQDKLILTK